MDPITHAAIGAVISKIGGQGLDISNAATIACTIGAVFPDADILLQKWGDYVYLKNHRGVSHSFVGLIASSVLISAVLCLVYKGSGFFSLFVWALAGCLSHLLIDMFNSYGAKALWPFSKRKFSLDLLVSCDPVILLSLVGYLFVKGPWQYLLLGVFGAYLIFKIIMQSVVKERLQKRFNAICYKITILPSMKGLLHWHFVIEGNKRVLVGNVNVLNNKLAIVKKLRKLDVKATDKAMFSPVGKFFSEFTPVYHIACEKAGGITRYVFIDLRYYIRNNFLHHGVLEIDNNKGIVKNTFNPYSLNRSSLIKVS